MLHTLADPTSMQSDERDERLILAEAIRKADPNYDPKKDPDLNARPPAPAPPSLPDLRKLADQVPGWAWGAGVVVLLFWLGRRKEK